MKRLIMITTLFVTIIFAGNLFAQNSVNRFESVNGKHTTRQEKKLERPIDRELLRKVIADKAKYTPDMVREIGKTMFSSPGILQKHLKKSKTGAEYDPLVYKLGYVTKKSKKDDVATVTLQVIGDPWGDGSGFQFLLDKDHLISNQSWESVLDLYAVSEYKIPENANGDFSDLHVIMDDTGSVDIPEGIYDFVVLNPSPERDMIYMAVWMDTGGAALIDDFVFKAGYEYIFTIENSGYVVFEPEYDAKMSEIILPPASEDLTDAEEIKIVFVNNGEHDFSNVELSYSINGGNPVTEIYTGTVTPKSGATYTFTTKADLSGGGLYGIEAKIDYELDLNSLNNSIVGYTRKPVPVELPFVDNFDDPAALTKSWTIIDANEDEITWKYNNWNLDVDGKTGALQASLPFQGDYGGDDYLITDPLIIPSAGFYHIIFYTYTFGKESLKILYGTSPNPEEMSELADYPELESTEWKFNVKNFEIETPGNYYFAFYYYSHPNTNGWILDFDNVTIGEGRFVGVPDITFNRPLVPVSGCNMTSESIIGADVKNIGNEPITEFTATYRIGDSEPVTQTFYETIGLEESVIVYFDQKADFSALGEYEVKFSIETPDEENLDNNETGITVRNLALVTELPFESDFTIEEDIKDWNPEFLNGWIVSDGVYSAVDNNVSLVSRCVTLEPGTYNFTYEFSAGFSVYGLIFSDDFYVTYGKSGTDPSTWERVKDYVELFTDDSAIVDAMTVNITEAGEYVFAFVPLRINSLKLFKTSLEIMSDHDFNINDVISPYSIPRLTPVYHIDGEKTFTVVVENKGKSASENGTIELSYDNNVIASENFNFTSIGEIKEVDLNATFGSIQSGPFTLKFEASLESGISTTTDVFKHISDTTFAWDNIDTGFYDGIGTNGRTSAFGLIYEIQKKDILTSITVGLFENGSSSNMGLAVYPVDENLVLGDPLFEIEHPRTNGNNILGISFKVPATELAPGKYFFEVKQLDGNNISVVYDEDKKGCFYNSMGSSETLEVVTGFGYVHIRPNFSGSFSDIESNIISDNQLLLYPNPVKNTLNIKSEHEIINNIVVYDLTGSVIYTGRDINSHEYKLNGRALDSGVYLISIQTETTVISSKFIVE